MQRIAVVAAFLLIAACGDGPVEPSTPPEPDFSVLAGEWEVWGIAANEQWFTRARGTVTLGSQVSGQTVGVVGDWVVYTARLGMQYSYADSIWNQATPPRQLTLVGVGNGQSSVEVTASIPRSGRGAPLLHVRMGWPLPRRPQFSDLMYLSAPELNPQRLTSTRPASGDTIGWQMRRR